MELMMVEAREVSIRDRNKVSVNVPPFIFSDSRYCVSIAKDSHQKREALRLRHDVFVKECREHISDQTDQIETDKYDDHCFHIIVTHKATGKVVGTYRFQSWEMAQSGYGFYSSNQFEISDIPEAFLKQSLEIGRGCIHKDHRNGRVLFLLWKGLVASLLCMDKTTLFGCCSFFSRNQDEGLFLMNHLVEQQYVAKGLMIQPRQECGCYPGNNFDRDVCVPEIPMLFQKYLDFGAKVCSEPAIDREFGTIDYLVMLHFHQVDRRIYNFFTRGLLQQTG